MIPAHLRAILDILPPAGSADGKAAEVAAGQLAANYRDLRLHYEQLLRLAEEMARRESAIWSATRHLDLWADIMMAIKDAEGK